MIIQSSKFTFSEYFYAIDMNSFKPSYGSRATMDAIWFKRTRGLTAVCMGTLSAQAKNAEEFMINHDGRYGGNTEFKWNGVEMWSHNNKFLEMLDAHKIMDPILKGFPAIPKGYEGWFCIKGPS